MLLSKRVTPLFASGPAEASGPPKFLEVAVNAEIARHGYHGRRESRTDGKLTQTL
jgi:hypothetical protein